MSQDRPGYEPGGEPEPGATPGAAAAGAAQPATPVSPPPAPPGPYAEPSPQPYSAPDPSQAPAYQPYGGPASQPYAGQASQPYQQAPWAGQPVGGYPQPGYGPAGSQPAAGPRTPTIAVVGLVLSILLAPVGLVVSLVALGRTKRAGSGRGLAVAGSIVGGVLTVLGIGTAAALVPLLSELNGPRTAVLRLSAAVGSGSCDDFMAASTQSFRAGSGLASCDDLAAFVAGNNYQDNQVSVTAVDIENGVATVNTSETYLWLDDGQTYTDRYVYQVVKEDGAWRVDGVDLVGQ